jgi:hypothetical protein
MAQTFHYMSAKAGFLEDWFGRRIKEVRQDLFPDDANRRFMEENCHGLLQSFGEYLSPGVDVSSRHFSKFAEVLNRVRTSPTFGHAEITIDNGGFQIQQGFFGRQQVNGLISRYYAAQERGQLPADWAFTLDVAHGKENIFQSPVEMLGLNRRSLQLASQLPETLRAKMMYIEHYRLMEFQNIWNSLREEGYPAQFQNFATGGTATLAGKTLPLPVVHYAVPLTTILADVMARRLQRLRFHVLGNSQPWQLLVHDLIEEHVLRSHGIELSIKCDSTNICSEACSYKKVPLINLESQRVSVIQLLPKDLHALPVFTEALNLALPQYGFPRFELSPSNLYPGMGMDSKPKMGCLGNTLIMLAHIFAFATVERWTRAWARDLHSIYRSGELGEFKHRLAARFSQLNGGKLTKPKEKSVVQVCNTLQLLSDLDASKAQSLIREAEEKLLTNCV